MTACLNNTAVAGCYNSPGGPVSVTIHYTYDNAGAPGMHITDITGAVIAGATAANTSVGACAVASPDVEWLSLCDVNAGVSTKFERRSITSFAPDGTPTTVTTDFEQDRVTAYVATGTVGECACDPLPAAQRGIQAAW